MSHDQYKQRDAEGELNVLVPFSLACIAEMGARKNRKLPLARSFFLVPDL